jgi:MoaA/NifB/PqqE/SkfB family radical SAM enzyme
MRLEFNSLVLIPSAHCNIKCRHCAPECGPHSKQAWDVELLHRCLDEAAAIENLGKSVHFAGGEPFLYYPQMLELAQHARAQRFGVSIVTNAFWGVNQARAEKMVASLVEAGLKRVEVSTDVFHQEFIPIKTVAVAIRALKQHHVSVSLRVITSRRHQVDETLRQLSPDELDELEIVGSPVVPVGRARVAVPKEEYYLSPSGACGSCHSLLNLTVSPDGNVSPCCAGSEYSPSLSLGNVRDLPLDTIVRLAEWNALVKKLVFQGPAVFFDVLKEAGLGDRVRDEYTNICHACSELLSDPETAAVIAKSVRQSHMDLLKEQLGSVCGNRVVTIKTAPVKFPLKILPMA